MKTFNLADFEKKIYDKLLLKLKRVVQERVDILWKAKTSLETHKYLIIIRKDFQEQVGYSFFEDEYKTIAMTNTHITLLKPYSKPFRIEKNKIHSVYFNKTLIYPTLKLNAEEMLHENSILYEKLEKRRIEIEILQKEKNDLKKQLDMHELDNLLTKKEE